MSINTTRNCINAILDNNLVNTEYRTGPNFGFKIPNIIPGVVSTLLDPINTCTDKDAYQLQRDSLIKLFNHNYLQYKGNDVTVYTEFGPKLITCNL
jgi:phosphoenolpyruvate carboxykinase (ATP)